MHRWYCDILAKACQQMQRPLPCNTASTAQLTQFRKSSANMNDPWQAAVSLAATCARGTFNSTQVSITGSQLRSQFYRLATQQPVTSDTFRHVAHLSKPHTSAARVPGLWEPVVPKQGGHSFAQSALPAAARQLMTKAGQSGLMSHQLRSQSRPALKQQRPGELPLILFHVRPESICQSLHSEVMFTTDLKDWALACPERIPT